MLEFALHPNVYSTSQNDSLLKMLEAMWITQSELGNGHLYLISGYGNFNGGIRFYPTFSSHIKKGGKVTAFLSGNTKKELTSIQVVEELLNCGVKVFIVNKKHLLHAKCYGIADSTGEQLIVTSGNFTGTGMSLNGEASIRIDHTNLLKIGFSWNALIDNILRQDWEIYEMNPNDIKTKTNPAWKLLYNESNTTQTFDESKKLSMLIKLNTSDTLRIQAIPGTITGHDCHDFHLSNDAFHFFPALSKINGKGIHSIYFCNIHMNFINFGITKECSIFFDGFSNPYFRLGMEALRFTKIADQNDLALISRVNETHYELRIFQKNTPDYRTFYPYVQNNSYCYLENNEVIRILNL